MSRNGESDGRAKAVPLVYIQGEEMSRYVGDLIVDQLVRPWLDVGDWQFFDLSCASRLASDDRVVGDCVASALRVRAVFKEPTVTPTAEQLRSVCAALGRPASTLDSPNILLRAALGGYAISRDTLHVDGLSLGYAKPVLFDRYAVGGLYGAQHRLVGPGRAETVFHPSDGTPAQQPVQLSIAGSSAVVVFDTPLDRVASMARHFLQRCLRARVVPYVVTKRSVFRWQEAFWSIVRDVYEHEFRAQFVRAGVVAEHAAELQHLLTDSAAMLLIRWKAGGFGMCAGNYDGDVLTDVLAEVHGNPGFLTSVLVAEHPVTGQPVRLFEPVHGTAAELWRRHLAAQRTSFNPTAMIEGLLRSLEFRVELQDPADSPSAVAATLRLVRNARTALHQQLISQPTDDLQHTSANGAATEEFISALAQRLATLQRTDSPSSKL